MNRNTTFSIGKRIIVVEDEEIVAMMLEQILQSVGYVVDTFSTGEALLNHLPDIHPDLILMDVQLDGSLDGIETAELILDKYDIPVVFLTAHSNDDILQRIIQISPYGYLIKPYREKEMLCMIEVAFSRHSMEQALRESEGRYRTLFNNASDAVYLYELDESGKPGHFIEVNKTAENQLGYSSEEFLHLSPWEIYDECCHDDYTSMIQKLQEEGGVRCEMIHTARNGTRILVEVRGRCFQLNGRQVVLSICRNLDPWSSKKA